MSDTHSQGIGLPFRVYGLEGMVKTLDEASVRQREAAARLHEAVGGQGIALAKHEVEITDTKADVAGLANTVNKMVFILIGFAFTTAASAAGVAATIIITRSPT